MTSRRDDEEQRRENRWRCSRSYSRSGPRCLKPRGRRPQLTSVSSLRNPDRKPRVTWTDGVGALTLWVVASDELNEDLLHLTEL